MPMDDKVEIPLADSEVEKLARELEDLIFAEGLSIKGGKLRDILKDEFQNDQK
jgi:hypothetical protein